MTKLEQSEHWSKLYTACSNNLEYFLKCEDEFGLKIKEALADSLKVLKKILPVYDKISHAAPLFDFDAQTPGNGYRSFLKLVDKCLLHFAEVNVQMLENRWSYFFRKNHYTKEIQSFSELLATLLICLHHLETLYDWNEGKENKSLFTDHTPEELLDTAKTINQHCFYGRQLGFQFSEGVRRVLRVICSSMASYSEIYYKDGVLLNKVNNFVKYFIDPEARAERIVHISHWAEVEFCHSYWSLNDKDSVYYLYSMVSSHLKVNHVLHIPPEELIIESVDGSMVEVPIPMSHIGMKSIQVRLLSDIKRVGMMGTGNKNETLANQSNTLIVHCHGGGFVAQNSRTHEVYLRKWTKDLQIPILSIDYTLSLDAPFPRALEEIVYVYGWVLKNGRSMLGTTLEKIIFAGDSAGANLCICATLKCIELNLRLPDGIFMAYAPVLMEFIPSPSRFLSLTDPILPFGFMVRCVKAYAAISDKKPLSTKQNELKEKSFIEEFVFHVPKHPLLSPYLASDEDLAKMPPMKILSLDFDPCLDDCIMFGKKLRALGVLVTLDVLPDLVHGFLNLVGVSKEAMDASNVCIKRIAELIKS